jgi:hypothetical protein
MIGKGSKYKRPTFSVTSSNTHLYHSEPPQSQKVYYSRPTWKNLKPIRARRGLHDSEEYADSNALVRIDTSNINNPRKINTPGKINSSFVLTGPGKGVLNKVFLVLAAFTALYAAIMLKRNQNLDSPSDEPVDMGSRRGAFEGTKHFKKGTVGYGVNASIRAIYVLSGELGAARIGEVFNSLKAQEIMSREDTYENQMAIAKLEYSYWEKVFNDAEASLNDKVGGYAGTRFSPQVRVAIQTRMSELRSMINGNDRSEN